MRVGERPEEDIDRGRRPALPDGRGRLDVTVLGHEVVARGNDVDVVGLKLHPGDDLHHRHRRRAAEDFRDVALVVGREVDNDDEGHA